MANSFPGSGLVYVDQLAVGRSSGTGLLNTFLSNDLNTIQIRAESDTSGVVSYTGIAPAYLEYYRNVATGVDLTIQTKIQAAGSGGAIVFSPNSPSADLTPVERMRITKGGSVGIGTTDPSARFHVEQTTSGEVGRFRANVAGCADLVLVNNAQTWGLRVDNAVSNALHIRNFQNNTNIITATTGGSVGIGTTSPNARLHIQGSSGDGTATFRVNSTSAADSFNYAGTIINGCLCSNRNYILLIGQDLSNRNAGYIGYNHTGTTNSNNNFLTFGHYQSDNLLNLLGNGNVGVGTTSPSYRLHVNGTFYAAGSSIKYKEGICNYTTNSCLFMCLKPKTYQYKDEFKHLGKELKSETQIGLIAEEVAESHPELAILVNEEDNKVVRNVDYEKLSIILLSEVQKLRQEVDDLKNK